MRCDSCLKTASTLYENNARGFLRFSVLGMVEAVTNCSKTIRAWNGPARIAGRQNYASHT